MTGVEVWALAIGLSMDCLAVAVASGVIMERVRWRPMLTMAMGRWGVLSLEWTDGVLSVDRTKGPAMGNDLPPSCSCRPVR